MAFRPPFGYGPGNYPMVPGQQQAPRPGNPQFMQQGQPFPGMTPQTYPMMQQGNIHQGGNMQGQMYSQQMMTPGMMYPGQQGMMMQQGFQGQPGQQFQGSQSGVIPGAMMQHPQGQQVRQKRPLTEKEKQEAEKMKKERYFQEQKMKLQGFGRSTRPGLTLDMASSLIDSLGGTPRPKQAHKEVTRHQSLQQDDFGGFQSGPPQPGGSDFGSFQGGGPIGTQQESPNDDFGDFHTAAAQNQQPQVPSQGDDFGDFLAAPGSVSSETGSVGQSEGSVTSESSSLPEKKDPGISLESLMMMSADLSGPAKASKPFHHKPSLNEAKSHPSKATQSHRAFASSSKSRQWNADADFSSMFVVAQPEGAAQTAAVQQAVTPDQSGMLPQQTATQIAAQQISTGQQAGAAGAAQQTVAATQPNFHHQTGSNTSQGSPPMPSWCQNEQSLPVVYHQVLEATAVGGTIQTERLYPIFLLSGLEKQTLGQIWNLVNKTQPGQLSRHEMYMALALIAIVQDGQPISLEYLFSLKEAPVPKLSPRTAPEPQPPAQPPSQLPPIPPVVHRTSQSLKFEEDDDDFSDFREAPSAIPETTVISNSLQTDIDSLGGKFAREEENCYIFATSPTVSSSGHSSPVMWDQNSIYDKLRSRSRESLTSSSANSDRTPEDLHISDFKSAQPDPAASSLDDEFAGFQSSQFEPPIPSLPPPGSTFSSLPQAKASTIPTKSATSPNLYALTTPSAADDDFGDFSSHASSTGVTGPSETNFGKFQESQVSLPSDDKEDWGGFADFKHSSSVPNFQSVAEDKYAIFRAMDATSSEGDGTFGGFIGRAGADDDDSDTQSDKYSSFRIAEQSTGSGETQDAFGDFKQSMSSSNSSLSIPAPNPPKSESNFAGFSPPSQEKSNWAPVNSKTKLPSVQTSTKDEDFDSFFGSRPANSVNKKYPEDKYSVFRMSDDKPGSKSLFDSSPAGTSAGFTGTVFAPTFTPERTSSSEDKYDIFRSLAQGDHSHDLSDDFGDFSSGALPEDNPVSEQNSSLSNFNSTSDDVQRQTDFFGIDFDSAPPLTGNNKPPTLILDDFSSAPPSTVSNENSFSSSPSSEFSKKSGALPKLGSIQDIDLRKLDLDLNLGSSSASKEDAFGEFSSGPSISDEQFGDFSSSAVLSQPVQETSGPSIPPGLSGPPLMPTGSLIVGDRYAEVAGDRPDENRHATEWERCLNSCFSAIQKANDIFNGISSSAVCKEVTSSSVGNQYLKAVIEVYRVACRVLTSVNAMGVETDSLDKLKKDIDMTWTNLSAFLASNPDLQPDTGSFVFKTAILKPGPENVEKACGVCLLSVDARSKAFNRSEDFLKLSYGGRQYHATCANLWVNMVDSLLPALPLEALL